MSIISKMKMRCSISRNVGTSSSFKDIHGSMSLPWTTVSTNVKCFISLFVLSSTNYQQGVVGQSETKEYFAVFPPDVNVLEGDKIDCTHFKNSFMVDSANPIVHPIKNKKHHIYCRLSVM